MGDTLAPILYVGEKWRDDVRIPGIISASGGIGFRIDKNFANQSIKYENTDNFLALYTILRLISGIELFHGDNVINSMRNGEDQYLNMQ